MRHMRHVSCGLLARFNGPTSLIRHAQSVERHVLRQVDALGRQRETPELDELVRLFDGLSGRMCFVADSAECIRRMHPDRAWRHAAETAFDSVVSLMHAMNANAVLCQKFMQRAMQPDRKVYDHETEMVIRSFKRDFEASGAGADDGKHIQLVGLHDRIERVSRDFEREAGRGSRTRSTDKAICLLEELLRLRFQVAQLAGCNTPAELILADNLLSSAESVLSFLETQLRLMETTLSPKRSTLQDASLPDIALYSTIAELISAFQHLCQRLFRVSIRCERPLPGEMYDAQVLKLVATDAAGRQLGTVFLDLLEREDKDPQPAHYTIQCRKASGQPAVVVLSLPFQNLRRVSWQQGRALFHELGHALHSVLSETAYQTLSGTRGSTELNEVPSLLLERLYTSPQTQQNLNRTAFEADAYARLMEARREGEMREEMMQIQIAAMDQLLHSTPPGDPGWSVKLLETVQSRFASQTRPLPVGDNWHATVGHLAGYGGCYYAYSLCRFLADTIYSQTFQGDPLNGPAGALLLDRFLSRGGAVDKRAFAAAFHVAL